MATEQNSLSFSLDAGADLSSSQYLLVKLSSGSVVVCGNGERPAGVLGNAPISGDPAQVNVGPIVKVKAGAAVSAGAVVASDASGKAVTAASTDIVFGQAIDAASGADEVIRVIAIAGDVQA